MRRSFVSPRVFQFCVVSVFTAIFAFGCTTLEPPAELKPPLARQALGGILEAVDAQAAEASAQLGPRARADLFNGLAWFDERPGDVVLARDGRGMIRLLEGRFLALDHAPALPPEASLERAEAFFSPGGLGQALLGLSGEEELRYEKSLFGLEARFRFRQFHDGRRVFDSAATVILDDRGRFAGLSTRGLLVDPAPERGTPISQEEAEGTAVKSLLGSDEPLWNDVDPKVYSVEPVVYDLFPKTGRDELRNAYAVVLVPSEGIGGRREVLVDELTGDVLASFERAELTLDRQDEIWRLDGSIGSRLTWEGVLWNGAADCPGPDAPIRGATPFDRDLDETILTFCEADRFFAERGGVFGSTELRWWLDSDGEIPRVGIGASPLLSIGVNSGLGIGLAEGTARAEVVGHEFAHSLFSTSGRVDFSGGGPDAAAIEEHMADTLGMLLEMRMPPRNEDRCLLADDADSIAAIGAVVYPEVPCRGQALPWRSLCEPWEDNGGWCEGPRTYLDKAFNHYDIGFPARNSFGLSHTNLGIGNRPAAALMRPAGAVSVLEGLRVEGLGSELAERLYLGAATELPNGATWSDWGKAWIDAASAIDGSPPDGPGPVELQVRAAAAGAKIWSPPSPITSTGDPLPEVTRATRPAVASLVLADGRERTYFFYRANDFDDRLFYLWRDEVAGGLYARESDTPFQGPCSLGEARSAESPTATGSAGRLFVAWAQPDESGGSVGTVEGLSLLAENAAEEGCGDGWRELPTGVPVGATDGEGVERQLLGGPLIAIWRVERERDISPPEELIRCDPRFEFPTPPIYPRFPIGPLGPGAWSFDICNRLSPSPQEPPIPLPPDFTVRLGDFLQPIVQAPWVRSIPSLFDPLAPSFALADDELEHIIPIATAFRIQPQLEADFETLLAGAGLGGAALDGADLGGDGSQDLMVNRSEIGAPRTAISGPALPHPDSGAVAGWFRIKYFLPDGPPRFEFGRAEEQLVLAFRDPENRLRVVRYADPTPTNRASDGEPLIPVLAEDIGRTDPALASVRMSERTDYLTVLYRVDHNGRDTGLAYRTLRSADSSGGWTATFFTDEERIDQIRGQRDGTLRRRIDYAYARTYDTPAVAAGMRKLHLVTTELSHSSSPEPGDPDAADYDPYPDTSERVANHLDHIRYAELSMGSDGLLEAIGERPVRISDTKITAEPRIRPGRFAQVGALQVPQHRRIIRFYFPNGSEVAVKSRVR